jgi:hypothetical protein
MDMSMYMHMYTCTCSMAAAERDWLHVVCSVLVESGYILHPSYVGGLG